MFNVKLAIEHCEVAAVTPYPCIFILLKEAHGCHQSYQSTATGTDAKMHGKEKKTQKSQKEWNESKGGKHHNK